MPIVLLIASLGGVVSTNAEASVGLQFSEPCLRKIGAPTADTGHVTSMALARWPEPSFRRPYKWPLGHLTV